MESILKREWRLDTERLVMKEKGRVRTSLLVQRLRFGASNATSVWVQSLIQEKNSTSHMAHLET